MKLAHTLTFLVLFALAPIFAHAANATVTWVAPTNAVDGSALTGNQAVTSYQVWVSTSTIPTSTTAPPTATVTGATTTTQSVTAQPGDTIFARVKACNSFGCSTFTTEATAVVPGSAPGVPTSVTIEIKP